MMFKRASKRGKGYMPCLSLRNGISLLLIFVLLAGIFPNVGIEAKAENRIVMTTGEFIGYLKIALSRNTVYNNKYPYNVGYYNGSAISWDCWDLGRSIIWTNGRIVNNYTKGKYATDEEHSGLSGNWDGWTIMQQCPDLSSDFTHLIPGEWLATANWGHIGYYIGNGQVIECTPDWGGNGVKQTQISSTGARSMNGISGRPWQWHGMVPWIDYSAYGERIYKENCTYKVIKSFTFKDDMYGAANSVGDPVPVGSYITVREVWKNKYGNMWVKTADNKWVYAGWKYESGSWCQDGDQYLQFYSDNNKVAWDDNNLDGQIVPYGKPYTLAGHITSDASMVSVQGEFMKGAACWGNPTSTFGAYGTSYDVPNSDLDHALSFAALPESAELGLRITVKYRYNRGFQLASKTIKCTFSNVQSTSPTGYLLDPVVFNLDYYLEANPDVKAMNWSADVVQKHWLQNGVSEGRAASPAFDVAYYVNQNADLQGFSGNYAGAIEHYCTNGVYESRPTSSIFNIAQYKTNFPDLAESLSNDDYEIAYHFVGAGYKEERIANRPLMVYFDGNGGSVATGSKAIQKSRKYGTLPTPTRSGYSFDGWYTAASGGTRVTEYTIHDSIHEPTLYAHWSKRMVTGITLSSTAISLNVGDVQTLSATLVPSDAYDRSVTWSTSNSAVATVSSGRITAVGLGTATITCAANDGSGVSARCTVTVTDAHVHTSEMIAPIPASSTENGRTFGLRCRDCNEILLYQAVIDKGRILSLPKAVQCIEEEAFAGAKMEQIDIPEGVTEIGARAFANCKSLELVTIPEGVTKIADSAFDGCYDPYFCIVAEAGSVAAQYAQNHGYSLWTSVTNFKVHFDLNGGSGSIADIVVKNGAPLGTLPAAVRDYHIFDGWFTKPVGGNRVTAETIFDNRTEPLTLYAHWVQNTCTIIFNANGGSCDTPSKVIGCGDAIGALATATRTYYSFDGWYTAASGGSRVWTTTTFASDTTLYAHWTQNTCTITFDANEGSCDTPYKVIGCGDAIGALPTATRTYFNFEGWYTAAHDGSRVWTTTPFASSTTLYAYWSSKGYGSWSDWSTTAYSASSTRQVETKTESVQTGTKTTYSYDRFLYYYPVNGYYMSSYASNWATNQGYSGEWQYLTLDYALEYAGTTDGVAKYKGYYKDGNQYWWHQSVSTQPIYEDVTYYRYRDLIE